MTRCRPPRPWPCSEKARPSITSPRCRGSARELVLSALSRLAAAGVTAPDTVSRFAHPIVHTAILGDLSAAHRALLHERAARALAASGCATPSGSRIICWAPSRPAGQRTPRQLARAGAAALRRGDPETAVSLLARAVAEPPPRRGPGPGSLRARRGADGRRRPGRRGDRSQRSRSVRPRSSELRMQIALNLGDALAAARPDRCGDRGLAGGRRSSWTATRRCGWRFSARRCRCSTPAARPPRRARC